MRIAVCEDDAMECGQFMDALRGWDPTRSAEVFSDGASLQTPKGHSSTPARTPLSFDKLSYQCVNFLSTII